MAEVGIHSWSTVDGDIRELHKAMFGRGFRRIGRYVKLAQVAGARTIEPLDEKKRRDVGVFLGTGLGNTADIVPLAQGILDPERSRVSPIAFAGCVGNAAAFFVARALGTQGPNVTVSQEELSFEGALMDAWIQLRAGQLEWALVGGVDVRSGDDDEQRSRIHAPDAAGDISDGAAFVLLGPAREGQPVLESVAMGSTVPTDGVRCWRFPDSDEGRLSPTASALRMVDLLEAGGSFAHVQRSSRGTVGRIQVRA
ncbi:MAG: hypothetical protein GY913_03870 [Proteobacteria bacterium]|nr:hypothetical protein [Pseudomonadota bacterium]MCP4916040.1 hypothetical protein [Pseudomonadota bacterium]